MRQVSLKFKNVLIHLFRCGVSVHEGCYAVTDPIDDQASVVSNFSTEPWFCEPCLFDLEKPPHCELCPVQVGLFLLRKIRKNQFNKHICSLVLSSGRMLEENGFI
jgi:hypothetical protein